VHDSAVFAARAARKTSIAPMNPAVCRKFVVRRTISPRSATMRDGIPLILSQRSCPIHGRVNFRYRIVLQT
jgi:hypothetical protein